MLCQQEEEEALIIVQGSYSGGPICQHAACSLLGSLGRTRAKSSAREQVCLPAEHPGLREDLGSGTGLLSMALNFIKAPAGNCADNRQGRQSM